jgi:hypothetical protein
MSWRAGIGDELAGGRAGRRGSRKEAGRRGSRPDLREAGAEASSGRVDLAAIRRDERADRG